MKRFSILLIATIGLIFLLNYCHKDSNLTVKLNSAIYDSLKLSADTKIIQLETTKDCNLGMIHKTNVDDNRIFIASDFNLLIFDGTGKFITKLNQGKGPKEITRLTTFSLNKEKKLIYAVDMASNIVVIDYNGNVIDKFSIRDFCSIDIFCLDENNLLLLNNWVGHSEKNFVGKYNLTENSITEKYINSKESSYPINTLITTKNFSRWNGDLYFYTPNVFSLFKYANNDFTKVISFDIEERFIPKSLFSQFQTQNRNMFREETKNKGYTPFLLYAFPFDDFYLVGLDDKEYSCYAVNKDNFQNIYKNGPISTYFGLPRVRSLRSPSALQDDCIIFVCNPMDFFENEPDEKNKEINIGKYHFDINYNDNPLIIVISNKKQ